MSKHRKAGAIVLASKVSGTRDSEPRVIPCFAGGSLGPSYEMLRGEDASVTPLAWSCQIGYQSLYQSTRQRSTRGSWHLFPCTLLIHMTPTPEDQSPKQIPPTRIRSEYPAGNRADGLPSALLPPLTGRSPDGLSLWAPRVRTSPLLVTT